MKIFFYYKKKKEEKKMRIFPLQNLEFKSVGSTFAKVLGS